MINRIKQIVSDKTVAIVLHGKSVEELENRITEFENSNIVWVSLGLFTIVETFILNRIKKSLSIVFDCATVPESKLKDYELNARLPRLAKFLDRNPDNVWITTHGIIRDSLKGLGQDEFLRRFEKRIVIVDELFPRQNIGDYMEVPNSVTLFIGALLAGNAKRIIIFGLDGYKGNIQSGVNSYYKPDEIKIERQIALGSNEDSGINRDTLAFEKRFPVFLDRYRKLFKNNAIILNCSPNSLYTEPPEINYNELKKWI